MLQVPRNVQEKYNRLLVNSPFTKEQYANCRKWLRYYPAFLEKLKAKKQSGEKRKEAEKAIILYYSGLTQAVAYNIDSGLPENSVKEDEHIYPAENFDLAHWKKAIENLKNEILVRHYSPRTVQAYVTWAIKLQHFVKNKMPGKLTSEDVKSFLTFLAVEKKVSASSQNQAFNGLLFFFRNVLKKEFGKIDGVVRAKRKPYIPVVLSRKEVNRIIKRLQYPYQIIEILILIMGY